MILIPNYLSFAQKTTPNSSTLLTEREQGVTHFLEDKTKIIWLVMWYAAGGGVKARSFQGTKLVLISSYIPEDKETI